LLFFFAEINIRDETIIIIVPNRGGQRIRLRRL
jgi:hypothetical protein